MNVHKLLAPFLFVSLLVLSGCGGGGSSTARAAGNDAATEQAVVDTVAGLKLFRDYSNNLVAYAGITNSNPKTVFHDTNLYYRVKVAPGKTTVTYFTDPVGTDPAGSIVLTGNNNGTFPETLSANIDVTGGKYPGHGNLVLAIPAGGVQNFALTGQLTEQNPTGTWGIVTWSFSLVSTNGLVTGSLSATNGVETVSLTNITESQSGSDTVIKGTLAVQPQNISEEFTLILHSDGSDSLVLTDGTTATVTKTGAGTITFPDGFSVSIGNFYRGV